MKDNNIFSLDDYRIKKIEQNEKEKKELEQEVSELIDNLSEMIKLYEQKLQAVQE